VRFRQIAKRITIAVFLIAVLTQMVLLSSGFTEAQKNSNLTSGINVTQSKDPTGCSVYVNTGGTWSYKRVSYSYSDSSDVTFSLNLTGYPFYNITNFPSFWSYEDISSSPISSPPTSKNIDANNYVYFTGVDTTTYTVYWHGNALYQPVRWKDDSFKYGWTDISGSGSIWYPWHPVLDIVRITPAQASGYGIEKSLSVNLGDYRYFLIRLRGQVQFSKIAVSVVSNGTEYYFYNYATVGSTDFVTWTYDTWKNINGTYLRDKTISKLRLYVSDGGYFVDVDFAMFCKSTPVAPITDNTTKYLNNSDFEAWIDGSTPNGWTLINATPTMESAIVYSGSRSLSCISAGWVAVKQAINISTRNLFLSFAYNYKSGTSYCAVTLYFSDGSQILYQVDNGFAVTETQLRKVILIPANRERWEFFATSLGQDALNKYDLNKVLTSIVINSQAGNIFFDNFKLFTSNIAFSGDTSNGSLTSINVQGTIRALDGLANLVSTKTSTIRLFDGVGWMEGRFTSGWKEHRWYYRDPNSSYLNTDGNRLSISIIGAADSGTSALKQFPTPLDPRVYKYVIVRVMGTSNAWFEVIVGDNYGRFYETVWVIAPSSYMVYAFAINSTGLHLLTDIRLCIRSSLWSNKTATVYYDFAMLSTSPSTSRNAGDGESVSASCSGANFSKNMPWSHTNTTYIISATDGLTADEACQVDYTVRRLRTHSIDQDGRNVAGATVKHFSSSLQTDAYGWTDGLILQQTNLKINATWQGALVNDTFNYNLTTLYNVLTVRCKIYNLKIIVKDLYGSPIDGCLISATLPNGTTIQATSNASGMAVFQTLPGSYKVTISYFGQTNSVEGDIPQASTVSIVFFGSLLGLALTVLWVSCLSSIVIVWRTGTLPLLVSKIKSSPRKLVTAGSRLFKAGYIFVRYPSRYAHLFIVNYPMIPLLLMLVPLISLIDLSVQVENFALAAFLFGLVGAFLSVFHWKILIYFKEEWKMCTSKSLTSYWYQCSENKATPFTINFIVFILAAMVFMLQENNAVANVTAVYAFYFLVIGVVFSFLDMLRTQNTH